jgi:hypothetical protein
VSWEPKSLPKKPKAATGAPKSTPNVDAPPAALVASNQLEPEVGPRPQVDY